jgi:hypothetical protein
MRQEELGDLATLDFVIDQTVAPLSGVYPLDNQGALIAKVFEIEKAPITRDKYAKGDHGSSEFLEAYYSSCLEKVPPSPSSSLLFVADSLIVAPFESPCQ